MDEPRPEKVAVVAEVKEKFEASDAAVLTEYRGLNVKDLAELRHSLRDGNGEFKIYKNSLVKFATKELDLDLDEHLTGPTAIAFVSDAADGTKGDPVSVAKALTSFAKAHPELVIKGGLLDGEPLSPEMVSQLSKVASRDELLARFAGGLAAPMQKFAALLKAVPANFAYGLAALIEAGGGPDAPADAPAAADDAPAAEEADADDAAAGDAPAADDADLAEEAPGAEEAAGDNAPAAEETAAEAATEEAPAEEAAEAVAPEAAAAADAPADDAAPAEEAAPAAEAQDTEVSQDQENQENPEEG